MITYYFEENRTAAC